ncbi:MAG TPA: hypothetical protein VIV66_13430, partial [Pyrinomonadaceae bacterium]
MIVLKCQPALLLWQDVPGVLRRIWQYVNHDFALGNIHVSLTSLATGLCVLLVTVFVSRTVTALLDRRMSKRAHVDPGLRYTICRLAKYL